MALTPVNNNNKVMKKPNFDLNVKSGASMLIQTPKAVIKTLGNNKFITTKNINYDSDYFA